MDHLPHKKSADELVHDNSFILWCLFPSEELDKQWRKDYLAIFPEEAETIRKAQEQVSHLKFNHIKLSQEEKNTLEKRISADYEKRNKAKRFKLVWKWAAACVIAIVLTGSLYGLFGKEESRKEEVFLTNIELDPEQEEVELLLPLEKVQVADNSTIQVDKKGNIQVGEEKIKSTDQAKTERLEKEVVHMNLLSVPKGRRSSLILSDGTKVWLNAGTVLQFPETFSQEKRTIHVSGEIYLEVTKDPDRPFSVKTDRMEIQVLGTSFGITAYDDESRQLVVLKEGRVSVRKEEGEKRTIFPNECLTLEENDMTVKKVDVYNYLSWVEGVLQFHEKELGDVLRSLSRYYRVQFDCPADVKRIKCSGKLVLFDDINQVLQTLQQTLSVSFSHDGEVINIRSDTNS